jgi:hypothetical protein
MLDYWHNLLMSPFQRPLPPSRASAGDRPAAGWYSPAHIMQYDYGGRMSLARRYPAMVGVSGKLVALVTALVLMGVVFSIQPAHAGPAFGTLLVRGQDWLGGRGVDVYSNGTNKFCCGASNYMNGTYVGIKWQCVELAQRLYTARGWHKGSFGAYYAYQIFDRARAIGMQPHLNGDGYVPVPGDLIIIGQTGTNPAGHVSIVKAVYPDRIEVREQNWGPTQTGIGIYSRSGSKLARAGLPIRGVVHSPSNLPEDLNGDRHVNIFDLSMLIANWGKSGTGDINGDGTVNALDLSLLLSKYE